MTENPGTENPEFVLDRNFKAPRPMVWRAWTDPDLITRWYGPGVDTIVHKFDFRPGGQWLGEMRWGENSQYSVSIFQEIEEPEKLVWDQSSSDAEWNIIANPMMADWPRIVRTIVTFRDQGPETFVRLTWVPHDATDAEKACFAGTVENMGKGWESGFAIMDEILSELQGSGS